MVALTEKGSETRWIITHGDKTTYGTEGKGTERMGTEGQRDLPRKDRGMREQRDVPSSPSASLLPEDSTDHQKLKPRPPLDAGSSFL